MERFCFRSHPIFLPFLPVERVQIALPMLSSIVMGCTGVLSTKLHQQRWSPRSVLLARNSALFRATDQWRSTLEIPGMIHHKIRCSASSNFYKKSENYYFMCLISALLRYYSHCCNFSMLVNLFLINLFGWNLIRTETPLPNDVEMVHSHSVCGRIGSNVIRPWLVVIEPPQNVAAVS